MEIRLWIKNQYTYYDLKNLAFSVFLNGVDVCNGNPSMARDSIKKCHWFYESGMLWFHKRFHKQIVCVLMNLAIFVFHRMWMLQTCYEKSVCELKNLQVCVFLTVVMVVMEIRLWINDVMLNWLMVPCIWHFVVS